MKNVILYFRLFVDLLRTSEITEIQMSWNSNKFKWFNYRLTESNLEYWIKHVHVLTKILCEIWYAIAIRSCTRNMYKDTSYT